ncbi:MAG TPA: hypothetical protein V6C65_38390, partial [Allocoleopsis sp.]
TSPQRLQLTLTLSTPEDLKVREGDHVKVGQILSDRVRERQRLAAQQTQLQLQMERLDQPIPGPPAVQPIPEVAGLPPASFLDEVAAVEQAKLKVEQAERNVTQQQRLLDMLQSRPAEQLPEATLPHETEVLKQRQQELDQARADQQLAEAKLNQAQSDRQYQEYQHSLEMSKRAITIQQAQLQRQEELQRQQIEERDRSFQLAQLQSQMQQLETQLLTLSAIRSPYNGTIQRVKVQQQRDQNLMVELVLVADPAPNLSQPGEGTGATAGANPTPNHPN